MNNKAKSKMKIVPAEHAHNLLIKQNHKQASTEIEKKHTRNKGLRKLYVKNAKANGKNHLRSILRCTQDLGLQRNVAKTDSLEIFVKN